MAKKEIIYQGLNDLNVLIDDTTQYSPDYFRVTNLPGEFTAGINIFKFKGNPSLFPENSPLYIEVLDANGLPVYYEIGLDLESQEQTAIISVYINEDTTPGNGSITICGQANQSSVGQILDASEINVRWTTSVYIDISKRNADEIIFDELPEVTITATTGSYTNLGYKGNIRTNYADWQGVQYIYRNGEAILYTSSLSSPAFPATATNTQISISYGDIQDANQRTNEEISTSAVFTSSISSYSGSGIAYLTDPIIFPVNNSSDQHIVQSAIIEEIGVVYEQSASLASQTTQNTHNIAVVQFSGLQPQVGEVAKIRSYYKSAGVREYIFSNETDISNLADEFGFTANIVTASFALPTIHRNDRFDFKFEFVNAAGYVSKQVLEYRDVLFQGGNTYIGGEDNLITGSLYVAGATGTGVHISGKENASMIRSIGYEGFQKASAPGGKGGFVIYSGSVQPLLNASEQYSGVGIELFANTSSYFKYTTSGSGLLDIRTNRFFLGNPSGSYISGSGNILQISSSNFSISPQGNVYIKGNINATEGLFENIIISGVTPQSQISGSSIITKYLIEPWFTSSAVIQTVLESEVGWTNDDLNVSGAPTMSFGLSRWRGDGVDPSSGKPLFEYARPKAATYRAGSGSFDDRSYLTKTAQDFKKLGELKNTFQIPEYQDKIEEPNYTVDNLIMPVGSDSSVFSLTSDYFHISSSILSKAEANFKPLVLQFAAKFGNRSGFKNYGAEFNGRLLFRIYIYDENNNELYKELKLQNTFSEWMDINIPLTPILTYREESNGSFNVHSKFKIKLEWEHATSVSNGSQVTHIRFTELRIVQLAESEGLKTKILQFKDSAFLGGTAGTLSYGSISPLSGDLYDLGISNVRWKGIYSSTISTGIITSSAINSSEINNGFQNRNLGFYNIICGAYLSGSTSQLVVGTYNRYTTAQNAFIIGNGTSNANRSNLVFASGTTFQITGSLQVSGSITGSLQGTASYATQALSASWAPLNAGGTNTQIQFNSGSALLGTGSFTFNYQSQSLQHGLNVTASGLYSHAEGFSTVASGSYSHAEGQSTISQGQASHAEGLGTQARGNYSHTEGQSTKTFISKAYKADYFNVYAGEETSEIRLSGSYLNITSKFKIGDTIVYSDKNFANVVGTMQDTVYNVYYSAPYTYIIVSSDWEGEPSGGDGIVYNISTPSSEWTGNQDFNNSTTHAEGVNTIAFGDYSHAEGQNTISQGQASHAEGYYTEAVGFASHAEGLYSIALGNYQHVQGQYNISSSAESAFIIGNGTSNTSRRNLVFASGSQVQITGSLNVAGSSIITGSLTVGSSSPGPAENTLTLGARDTGGEGGQIGFNAPGGTYTSASYIDNYQNQFRILKGNNTTSNSGLMVVDMTTNQTQFFGAVTASAYSGLPNAYLYAYRSGSNQTITGDWANKDIIFNSTGANNNISYNTGTGIATLKANKVYRITATVAWSAAGGYVLQHQIYNQTTSGYIGPIAEVGQPNSTTWNGSTGVLEYIFAVGSSDQNISIRTTSSTTGFPGESIRHDLNTVLIIQQIA